MKTKKNNPPGRDVPELPDTYVGNEVPPYGNQGKCGTFEK